VSGSVTFDVRHDSTVVPGDGVDALLGQLGRPRGGQAQSEGFTLASIIRAAIAQGTPAVIEDKFAAALGSAIEDLRRAQNGSPLGRELTALQRSARNVYLGPSWNESPTA
jgi:hypothetical protein